MFRLADQGAVWWPVELSQANGPGNVETVIVHVLYRIFTRKELRERERDITLRFVDRMKGRGGDSPTSPDDLITMLEATEERQAGDLAELQSRVLDWRGFADGDDEVAFSPERLAALLEFEALYKAFRDGLFSASREAPGKNSSPGPGGTPAPAQA